MAISNYEVTLELIQWNNDIMKKIIVEDLEYLEKDLEFYEIVSLYFLIFGYENEKYGLQLLITEIKNQSNSSSSTKRMTGLMEWARQDENWRDKLLESLCIINANHVIEKLGLNLNEIRERFLPHIPEINDCVHPVLKVLYMIAEKLSLDETRELISFVNETHSNNEPSNQIESEFLEMNYLDWIQRKIIKLGDWSHEHPNKNMTKFCDLSAIISYLKKITKFENLSELLQNCSNRINFTKNNQIPFESLQNVKMDKMGDPNRNESSSPMMVRQQEEISSARYEISKGSNYIGMKYIVTKQNAGFLLVINIEEYTENSDRFSLPKRIGTEHDVKELNLVFSQFGYNVVEMKNLKSTEIIKTVDEYVKKSHEKDSLIICILSHGTKGTFYGSDTIAVSIQEVVNSISVKELKEKPKVIILQACQGNENKNLIVCRIYYSLQHTLAVIK